MPARIAEVLRDIDADVIALQEVVGAGPAGSGQAEEIGAALGMGWVMASVRHLRHHLFGNVVMSRFPIVHHANTTCRGARASRAAASAPISISATAGCCTSTTSTSAPPCSSAATRRRGSPPSSTITA